MDNYHTNSHSKYLLKVHVIFCVHYRLKIINRYAETLKETLLNIAEKYEFHIDIMEVDKDHIHLLIDYPPKLPVSWIVQVLKSITTRILWEKHSNTLKKIFWSSGRFWSDGYFVASTGDVSTAIIRKYIENQG